MIQNRSGCRGLLQAGSTFGRDPAAESLQVQRCVTNDSIVDCGPWPACHSEKGRGAAGGSRLRLVAGRRPIGRALAPVGGATGQPFEIGMSGEMFEHRAEVVAFVGRETQFGIVRHDFSQGVESCARHDPAFVLPAFWPRVRKQDERAIDRGGRKRRHDQACIIGKDPNIVEPTPLDLAKQLDYPVLEYFAADKRGLRILLGQAREMLAAAETDLEPNRGACDTEECSDVEVTRCRKIYCQSRQQFVDEGFLPGTQGPPATAAEDLVMPPRLAAPYAQNARRSSSTRSSLSHEKPPSGSGGRPKWP